MGVRIEELTAVRAHGLTASAVALVAVLVSRPGVAQEVTPERLLNAAAEPQNWLMNDAGYAGHRYSALDEIDQDTVAGLRVLFSVPLGGVQGAGNYTVARQASPLVDGGFMYLVDGWGRVYKLDLGRNATNRVVWSTDPGQDNVDAWLQARQGLAFWRNHVIAIAADGQLHWLDRETGALVRSVQVDDPTTGYSLATPPLVIGDLLVVGGAGGDRGARAHIDGLDAATGAPVWRTYAVPAPGEPGAETWGSELNAWQHGGGSFMHTGSYDAQTGLTIWGTAEPAPLFEPELRPGDNLYTDSALALDAMTGAIRWHFQYTPGDHFGFPESGSHHLIEVDGRRLVAHFGRNGFFYVLDASDGAFQAATPYVEGLAWTAGIDAATGLPVEYQAGAAVHAYAADLATPPPDCPNIRGVPFLPTTFSPRTGLAYGAGADGCVPVELGGLPDGGASGWLGGRFAGSGNVAGSMAALDAASGELEVARILDFPIHAGLVSTAGGLVFVPTADGSLQALDDETLETLWRYRFATLTSTPPITYAVEGRQYVAVVIGGNPLVEHLAYQPTDMIGVQPLFVLAVLGL